LRDELLLRRSSSTPTSSLSRNNSSHMPLPPLSGNRMRRRQIIDY